MIPSQRCYDLIKSFEGLSLKAYLDPIGIPTIGYGSIRHPDGRKVKMGDKITRQQADEYLEHEVKEFAYVVSLVARNVNQHQFDALVSFSFNVGSGSLRASTLLKKVRENASDPTIRNEFLRWNKAGGQVLTGLTRRRKAEADIYFS